MTSNPEATAPATCKATTKLGRPCKKPAVERGLCTFHSGAIDLAAAGRQGGKARGRKKEESADRLQGLAETALEEMLRSSSGSATARAAAARLVLDRIPAASADLARRAIYAEQEAAAQAELPLAREKLARLIERRAQELAEAMTAEQIAELVERKAEERAKQLYAERMRAETEAVRAELDVT
jgi:Family of unknown function (DUF5763)